MKEKPRFREDHLVEDEELRILTLHNDDVHTFDYVIEALVDICQHEMTQAEQCTMIVHFKGRCSVKEGPFKELKPMKDRLLGKELNATID
jgi:ATP-dependent Clp protease adaptor protein ClpS